MVQFQSLARWSGLAGGVQQLTAPRLVVRSGSWAARHQLTAEEIASAAAGFALDLPLRQLARLAGVPLATAHRLALTFRMALASQDPAWTSLVARIDAGGDAPLGFVVSADGGVQPAASAVDGETFAGLVLSAAPGAERAARRVRLRLRRYRGLATRLAPLYLKECELRARMPAGKLLETLLEALALPVGESGATEKV